MDEVDSHPNTTNSRHSVECDNNMSQWSQPDVQATISHRFHEPHLVRQSDEFVSQARRIVANFTTPRPAIYWADMLGTMVVAYTASSTFLSQPFGSPLTIGCYLVGALGVYRLSMFIHEIVHFRRDEMNGFRIAWNVLAGIPMLLPSFFYDPHLAHHNTHHYGTNNDGEYLPLARGAWYDLALFLFQIVFQPAFFFLRFLVGTPVSFLHPKLRAWTLRHASSYVINFRYCRPIPQKGLGWAWTSLELACSARAWAVVFMILIGVAPWTRLIKLCAISSLALGINHLRTLAAHRYRSAGEPISHEAQFLDSTNISGGWLTEFICPVGLRYHALHHLFPAIPYHRLGAAHKRLLAELPADSPYRETVYPSYASVIRDLLVAIRLNQVARP